MFKKIKLKVNSPCVQFILWIVCLFATAALLEQSIVVFTGSSSDFSVFPTDRCSSLFSDASLITSPTSPSKVIYGHTAYTNTRFGSKTHVRICADNSATTTEHLKRIRSNKSYTELSVTKYLEGCDPTDKTSYSKLVSGCDASESSPFNCSQILHTHPFPTGVMWKYDIPKSSSNCKFKFRNIAPNIKGLKIIEKGKFVDIEKGEFVECDQDQVYFFQQDDLWVGILLFVAFFFELIIQILLLFYAGNAGIKETACAPFYYFCKCINKEEIDKEDEILGYNLPPHIQAWKIVNDVCIGGVTGYLSFSTCPPNKVIILILVFVIKLCTLIYDVCEFVDDKAYERLSYKDCCNPPTNTQMLQRNRNQIIKTNEFDATI